MSNHSVIDRWNDPLYISELTRNVDLVRNISRFANCHPDTIDEAMRLRTSTGEIIALERDGGVDNTAVFDAGYNMFQVPKNHGGYRTISEPAPALKSVQGEIGEVLLSQIPTFTGAVGGEIGKSFIDNARMHARNHPRYLVNTDLAAAYPSVSCDRLFVNLRSTLRKKLEISFPQISGEQQDQMIDMLVILISHNDELPQGASTSMKALNIVMAKADQRIMQFLHGEEAGLHSPLYTRYVDDVSVSWKEFSDMTPVWKVRTQGLNILKSVAQNKTPLDSDSISSYIGDLERILSQIEELDFVINSRKQRSYIIGLLEDIRTTLHSFDTYVHSSSQSELVDRLDYAKRQLRMFRYDIEQSKVGNHIQTISRGVQRILVHEGWKINHDKTKMFTPASKKQKVITGVSVDSRGRLGVPTEKEAEIIDFLQRVIYHPTTLPKKYHGNNLLIAQKVLGYKNFLIQVRGKINRDLAPLFREAKNIYFPNGSEVAVSMGYSSFTYNGS